MKITPLKFKKLQRVDSIHGRQQRWKSNKRGTVEWN